MKKAVKIIAGAVAVILVVIGAILVYISNFLPDVSPAKEMNIVVADSLLNRGQYLANHVTVCMDCHSERDWSKYSGPVRPGTFGAGGDVFSEDFGFPGTFYARNITPQGIGNWTDGELARLITTGVTKDGEPIFPVMPYLSYSHLDPYDLQAIIAYVRTLTPIRNSIPASSANFPMNFILRTIPRDADLKNAPLKSDSLAYGKYLTTISGCADCHTPQDKGEPIMELFMAGGFEFNMGPYTVRSANITPNNETGIGAWEKETFINRFKHYENPESLYDVPPDGYNTIMPWSMYAGMTEEDLGLIYKYLRTVSPVNHSFERYSNTQK